MRRAWHEDLPVIQPAKFRDAAQQTRLAYGLVTIDAEARALMTATHLLEALADAIDAETMAQEAVGGRPT